MSEQEEFRAGREARAEAGHHPEQPARHEEALRRYLGGAAYRERHMSRPRSRVNPAGPQNGPEYRPPWWAAPRRETTEGTDMERHNWIRRLFRRRGRDPAG